MRNENLKKSFSVNKKSLDGNMCPIDLNKLLFDILSIFIKTFCQCP